MKHYKRTIIFIMLTFLLLPVCQNFRAEATAEATAAADQNDYLKIGLKYGDNAVSVCTIKADAGFLLGTAKEGSFIEGMPLPAYTKLIAANENGAIVIRDENGILLSADLGISGCIMPADYSEEGIIYYENTPYRGGIMLLAKSNGSITVINYITLEHYVYGVLNAELYHTNPEEALKAQAVAARSFAVLNLGKHSADGFDLCSTTDCQVYKGFSGEYPATNSATDETGGEMIRFNGKPVTAFYYKNSGGYTQNVEDVWTFSQPYLKAIKDEYSPSYPWRISLSFDTIRQKLEASGYYPGTIQSISVKNRNQTGAVCELEIIGSKGEICLQKEKIRNVLGTTIIKSLLFQLGDSDTTGAEDLPVWRISNGTTISNPGADTYLVSGSGSITKADGNSIFGFNGTEILNLRSNKLPDTVTGGTASFSGYGYGHGVGMPQDSAVEMAKQGFTYDEILKHYYTGIEIR